MAVLNELVTPSLTFEEILSDGSTLSNPAADSRRLFLGEDGLFHMKDSAGTVTDVGGAGGSVATDTIWDAAGDLALGTGANTAARLAISATAGHVLKSNGTTGAWAWPTFIGAKAYHNTTQAVSDATPTVVLFNSEEYDTSTFHDNSTENGRMTAPITGYYHLTGHVHFATVTTGDVQIVQFFKNDTTVLRSQVITFTDSTQTSLAVQVSTTVALAATDWVEVRVYNFGAAATIGDAANAEQQNFFAVEFRGV